MIWIKYLLEANLYMVLFYAVYYLLLRRETHYQLNRFYLLGCVLLSFGIPLLQLGFLRPAPAMIAQIAQPINPQLTTSYVPMINTVETPVTQMVKAAIVAPPTQPVNYLLWAYLIIATIMAVALAVKIYQLTKLARKGKHTIAGYFNMVELDEDEHAFSFFSYLFISKKLTSSSTIIQHELVHIRQKHSIDIMFIELVKVVCWFNPLVYLVQHSLKELHEFIADDKIAAINNDVDNYTDFLISNAYGLQPIAITNNFFTKNLLKKRIMMLHQKRSGTLAKLKYLIIAPLMAGMLCLSTLGFTKDYNVYDLAPNKSKGVIKPIDTTKPTHQNKANLNLIADITKTETNEEKAALPKPAAKAVLADSLFGPKAPLIIIDGVKLTKENADQFDYDFSGTSNVLSKIPKDHIAGTEVLGTAAAMKLYGKAAQNGAIRINTWYGKTVAESKVTLQYPLLRIDGIAQSLPEDLKLTGTDAVIEAAKKKIPAELIKSLDVITGENAINAFGIKGAHGVVNIKTYGLPFTDGLKVKTLKVAGGKEVELVDTETIRDFLKNLAIKYPGNGAAGNVVVTFTVDSDHKLKDFIIVENGIGTDVSNVIVTALKNAAVPQQLIAGHKYAAPFTFLPTPITKPILGAALVMGSIQLPTLTLVEKRANPIIRSMVEIM